MATTKNVQSLERGFAILQLFCSLNKDEISLREISDALELNKSTVFGLVNTLSNLGYLQQNPDNQKYMLGMRLLSFSDAVKSHNLLCNIVHPYLVALNKKYNETLHCAVLDSYKALYIDKVDSLNAAIHINTQIGFEGDLHCTGVGKCLLAYMPQDYQDRYLSGFLAMLTSKTITDPDVLRKELEDIKKHGYGEDIEEFKIGLHCVAVPIVIKGKAVCSISMSSIESRMQEAIGNGVIEDLKSAANSITKELRNYI